MDVYCCQYEIVWEDRPANHAIVKRMLDTGRPDPGSLIVLPEMFDTGFSQHFDSLLQGAGCSVPFLQDLAECYSCGVIAGLVAAAENGKAYNRAVLVRPGNEPVLSFDKMYPFSPSQEGQYVLPGDEVAVWPYGGLNIAPAVCYDLRFPELFREALDRGANLFVVPANWPAHRWMHWMALLRARAIENQSWVIGVNRVGSDPHFEFMGHSVVFDPEGVPVAKAASAEQLLVAQIDPQAVERAREKFPAVKDRRRGGR